MSTFRTLVCIALALSVFAATPVHADDPAEQPPHSLQAGLNLRTDFGVHAFRIDLGYRYERLGVLLVADPMFWTDGQTSTDLTVFWLFDFAQPFLGWRLNTVPLIDGAQFQENLLLGLGVPFPRIFDGWFFGQWGLEMAMMLVKHGGGAPSESISFESGRHYIDFVQFGMFARFDFDWGFGG